MLLDHVNLRCAEPEAMVAFLERVGCAHRGERPDFGGNPGFWLYDDSGRAVIHVSTLPGDAMAGDAMGDDASAHAPATGVVDHVAFRVSDSLDALRAQLAGAGLQWTERENPLAGVTQLLVPAPEALLLELQVPLAD